MGFNSSFIPNLALTNRSLSKTTDTMDRLLGNLTLFNAVISSLNKSSLLDDTEGDEISLWDTENEEWDSRRKRESLGPQSGMGANFLQPNGINLPPTPPGRLAVDPFMQANPGQASQSGLGTNFLQPNGINLPQMPSSPGGVAVDPFMQINPGQGSLGANYLQPNGINLPPTTTPPGRLAVDPIMPINTGDGSQMGDWWAANYFNGTIPPPTNYDYGDNNYGRGNENGSDGGQNQTNFNAGPDPNAAGFGNYWNLVNQGQNSLGFVKLSALTLQGFLMLSAGGPAPVPHFAMAISECFQQIIWTPADPPTGLLCSRLTPSFRQDLRQVLLMVSRGELPGSFDQIQASQLVSIVSSSLNSSIFSVGLATPLTPADISAFLKSVGEGIKNMTESTDPAQQAAWKMISTLFTAFSSEEGTQLLADIAVRIQGISDILLVYTHNSAFCP